MKSDISLVLGIDPGEPRATALAASAVLSLHEPSGTIGVVSPSVPRPKASLATFLEGALLSDPRLCMVALAAPLTPVPLPGKPWMARRIEIRLSRGAFSGSWRGPQMPWICGARSWPRYREALPLLEILQARGFPLLVIPSEAPAAELPFRCTAEVFPKASLAVLAPREPLKARPVQGLPGRLARGSRLGRRRMPRRCGRRS